MKTKRIVEIANIPAFYEEIQWKPLNVITDNVINWLILS